MKNYSLLSAGLGILLVLTTFDAVVVPGVRLSIADLSLLLGILIAGFHGETLRRLGLFFGAVVPLVLVVNAAIFFVYLAWSDGAVQDFTRLISGFVRPILFVTLAILFYGILDSQKVTSEDIGVAIKYAGILLSFIVILQYAGVAPPMFHNNPSFGESGRFTVFSEGWRPTGLTNEASFVGIFLFLIFISSIFYRKAGGTGGVWRENIPSGIIFCGCLASTSRIALLLAVIFVFLRKPTFGRIFLLGLAVPIVFAFVDLSRFQNMLVFDGDASTIERYGSLFAYTNTLLDPANFFGTGYLNSVELVNNYADPMVMKVLGDRKLPAFSLPLQLLVELGPLVFMLLFLFLFLKYKRYMLDVRIIAVIVASALTGIQNFLFIYVFISLVIYERNSRSS